MEDDKYVIKQSTARETTQLAPHPKEQWRVNIAIVIATFAALFAGWQAHEAHQARIDANTASDAQKIDVERSMHAAEASAKASQSLATAEERTAAASERAADAAAESAGSGERSLSLTRKEIALNNEPILDAIDSKIYNLVGQNVVPNVMTRIYNAGKGVALQASVKEWMNISPRFEFSEEGSSKETSSTLDIPPGQASMITLALKWPTSLTSAQADAIKDGRLKLYVYGLARYNDNTFERPRRYSWRWCFWYDPNRPAPDAMLLTVCPEHNYTRIE